MPLGIQIRQIKYLNNIVEKNIRLLKRIRPMLGLKSFRTATSNLAGVETMHMIKKEQLNLQDQMFTIKMNPFRSFNSIYIFFSGSHLGFNMGGKFI